MSFEVAAEAYARFMGRYAEPLAPAFAELAGVTTGQRAIDVGCGPGALTAELVARLGEPHVCALDPSAPFVEACRARFPGEDLPFVDGDFDVALAQLVVHFMGDPVRGLAEMARATAPGGVVAACVWDHGGGRGPLSPFWRAAARVVPAHGEGHLPGSNGGDLTRLMGEAGLTSVDETELSVTGCGGRARWTAATAGSPWPPSPGPGSAGCAERAANGRNGGRAASAASVVETT